MQTVEKPASTGQIIERFRAAMVEARLTAPDAIHADGAIHRFSTNNKASDRAGWYCLYADGLPAGAFGDWRQGFTQTWCSVADADMSADEREANRQRMRQIQQARAAEIAQSHAQAQIRAQRMWREAKPASQHPYLSAKGVLPHGLRQTGSLLLVPLFDADKVLHSLQTIDGSGTKRFLAGGKTKGCYCPIGAIAGRVVVCEGFATGASIHQAIGLPVACAMNAGNLQAVAQALHSLGNSIIVAADDDHQTAGNPGMTAARQAALSVGGELAGPLFDAERHDKATDFNDLHQHQGLDAVARVFAELGVKPCLM